MPTATSPAPHLLNAVAEVAPWTVRAEPDSVVCPTEICLVLGMAGDDSQLLAAVGKLTLLSVLARAVFLKWATQLCLVATRDGLGALVPHCR